MRPSGTARCKVHFRLACCWSDAGLMLVSCLLPALKVVPRKILPDCSLPARTGLRLREGVGVSEVARSARTRAVREILANVVYLVLIQITTPVSIGQDSLMYRSASICIKFKPAVSAASKSAVWDPRTGTQRGARSNRMSIASRRTRPMRAHHESQPRTAS